MQETFHGYHKIWNYAYVSLYHMILEKSTTKCGYVASINYYIDKTLANINYSEYD